MIAVVTDSSSQVGGDLAERLGLSVVSMVVRIGATEHREADLDLDEFYIQMSAPEPPALSTAQPPPIDFLDAFTAAAEAGADGVVAVLVGSAYSGTVDSARIAAELVDLEVRIVDTAAASFGVGCAAWAAADAASAGLDLDGVETAAARTAASAETLFVLQGRELALRSGRFTEVDLAESVPDSPVPILWAGGGGLEVVAEVADVASAVDSMIERVGTLDGAHRAAVGLAHPDTEPIAHELTRRLGQIDDIGDVVQYRVGPSVAANVGLDTFGFYWWRTALG